MQPTVARNPDKQPIDEQLTTHDHGTSFCPPSQDPRPIDAPILTEGAILPLTPRPDLAQIVALVSSRIASVGRPLTRLAADLALGLPPATLAGRCLAIATRLEEEAARLRALAETCEATPTARVGRRFPGPYGAQAGGER